MRIYASISAQNGNTMNKMIFMSEKEQASQNNKDSAKDAIVAVGKRKTAVARASLKKGTGKVTINRKPLKFYHPEIARLKIEEPVAISYPMSSGVDIDVTVCGGGVFGQADAARQAIARALVKFSKSAELKQKFVAYDRNLLIYDPRRPETRKPSRSSQGARRRRQLSKR